MNPRQLQYILTIAEEKSISAAAKKLYVAQPSLSALVKRVEEELGCELFDRTVTPLKLTPAGEIYIKAVQEMMRLNQEMKNRLRDMDENPNGKLVVGIWPNIGIMPLVMQRFFEQFPNYDIEIINSMGEGKRLTLLEQGALEMSIQPMYGNVSSKFTVEQIGVDKLVLVVPSEFPINEEMQCWQRDGAAYPVINPQELLKLGSTPMVIMAEGRRLRNRIDELFSELGIEPRIKMINQRVDCCLDMAKYGVCATILPSSLVKYRVASYKVKCYEIDQAEGDPVCAIYVKDRYLSKAGRALIDILKSM